MQYLMRDGALLNDGQWRQIDQAVVSEAKKILVGRRFLNLYGPVGAQVQTIPMDRMGDIPRAAVDFWGESDTDEIHITDRRFLELQTIYADFLISWRDIGNEQGAGVQAAMDAAVMCARREDELVFFGLAEKGIDGIFTAQGTNKIELHDWNEGENPVMDVARALEVLVDAGNSGERALIVSTDLYAKLHRIQPGTGIMELERVKSMVDGKLFHTSRIDKNKAAVVYCDAHNMDLVVGQDLVTAYMGNEKMDHSFRVMETAVPRIKRPSAIAIIE